MRVYAENGTNVAPSGGFPFGLAPALASASETIERPSGV